MVMGLPPPEVDNMTSYRNFGLAHSIRDIFIGVSSVKGENRIVRLIMGSFPQLIPHRGLSRRPFDPEEEGERSNPCHRNKCSLI